MHLLIIIIGFIIGVVLNNLIESITYTISKNILVKSGTEAPASTIRFGRGQVFFAPIICALAFEILFLRLGFTILLAKAIAMTVILIIISFIDLRHRIIPDFMVLTALFVGITFSFIIKASFIDTILGMMCGGGILFLIALVPNALGGGDIKLMFAIGAFLGLNRTIWALLIAFVLSSIVSIALILYKIKGTKDYIPFGPFLSVGSFISLLILI